MRLNWPCSLIGLLYSTIYHCHNVRIPCHNVYHDVFYKSVRMSVVLVSSQQRVVRMVSDSLKVTATDRSGPGWKGAIKVDIVNFATNSSLKAIDMVSICIV